MTIDALTLKAQKVCENKGTRFTPIREKVFRLLAEKSDVCSEAKETFQGTDCN